MTSLTNNYEALVEALALAITAPNHEMAQRCAEMAVQIAERGYMNADEVTRAKAEALRSLGIDSPSFDDADTTAQEE